VVSLLPAHGRILEIGAGTGWQAKVLASQGYDVSAIDVPYSNYRENRIWPVIDYDGKNIPFKDNTFDIVFSSNVLEHILHIYEFQKEIHRVLKPSTWAIHVLPSGSWRFWTNITHCLKIWSVPKCHGEHAGNSLIEILYFTRRWWTQLFHKTGWQVSYYSSNGLFYTGHSTMDCRLNMGTRHILSRLLGSSCHIFVLKEINASMSNDGLKGMKEKRDTPEGKLDKNGNLLKFTVETLNQIGR
jgi:SAM-dependent methyltransferase